MTPRVMRQSTQTCNNLLGHVLLRTSGSTGPLDEILGRLFPTNRYDRNRDKKGPAAMASGPFLLGASYEREDVSQLLWNL
jgi:hypothetical protein